MSPATPARSDLQPEDQGLLEELARAEDARAAQRIERIADHEIILLLQLTHFDRDAPEWEEVARVLAEYGWGVFTGWAITGSLRRVAAKHNGGRGVRGLAKLPEARRFSPDDAQSLAADVIAVAIESFRVKTLLDPKRTWRPNGGASLKTYFVGRALMELPDIYVRWTNEQRALDHDPVNVRRRREGLSPIVVVDDGRHITSPDHAILTRDHLHELVADDPDQLALEMLVLQDLGHTLDQIADMLDLTEPQVRTRMTRLRQRARHLDQQRNR